ncbi:MAG: sigma-70 family RNA polymerase sigma factor [Oscillospiraceae bacterium]|nr:sigma-70 family RNA polymerase sigma factor [Oscillospiraceae bacterium]
MEDEQIVQLYWERSDRAISETAYKYGTYCRSIAQNILQNPEDAEEIVNDTWLGAWNAMPPHRPGVLSTFLGKLTRRISIDRFRTRTRHKRGGDTVTLALEELNECVPGGQDIQQELEQRELVRAIDRFLDTLPDRERRIFLCRYWYLDDIAAISARFGFTRSKVKSMLYRIRNKLRTHLQEEGYL